MTENVVPNSPAQVKFSTPSKLRPEEIKAKISRQQQIIENHKKTQSILQNYISSVNSEIEQLTEKIENQKLDTKEKLDNVTQECQKKLDFTIEQLNHKVENAKHANLFPEGDLISIRLSASNLQTDIATIKSDFNAQFALFLDDFRNQAKEMKSIMRKVFSPPTEEELNKMNEENIIMQDQIKNAIKIIGMQLVDHNKNPVSLSDDVNEYQIEKKEFVEMGTDASVVPETILCISDYTAKWMLDNADLLSIP